MQRHVVALGIAGLLSGTAYAQVTAEQLQRALNDARQATVAAQAAAEKAEKALAELKA